MRLRSLRESVSKVDVLKHALKLWEKGQCRPALDICEKYGISHTEFFKIKAKLMMRETELPVVDEEKKKKSLLDKNIIRALQTPISTAGKPSIDSAIMEALSKR